MLTYESYATSTDHPRACGEKHPEPVQGWGAWGSPPRMRGKVYDKDGNLLNIGITPAHAGKSKRQLENLPDLWDHPRVCGEK